MKKYIIYSFLFFILFTVCGCQEQTKDNKDVFSLLSQQERDFVDSFASSNNATAIVVDGERLFFNYYSIELEKLLLVGEHKKIAFPCVLLDVKEANGIYYIVVDSTFSFDTGRYILECSQSIAEELISLHPGPLENIVVVAILSEVARSFSTSESESNWESPFIARGVCSSIAAMPHEETNP